MTKNVSLNPVYCPRAGRRGDRSSGPGGVKNVIFSTSSRSALGPIHPLIDWIPEAFSTAVKRPESEDDHSPQTSTEFKNTRIYTSTLPYVFVVCCLIS